MVKNDRELDVTLERIADLQRQVAHLRRVETNVANYHASVSGFLAEIDRMQIDVREYLSTHPPELVESRAGGRVWTEGKTRCAARRCVSVVR